HERLDALLFCPRRGPVARIGEDPRAPAPSREVFRAGSWRERCRSQRSKTHPAPRGIPRQEALWLDAVAREETNALRRNTVTLERLAHGEERGATHPGPFVDHEELAVLGVAENALLQRSRKRERAVPGMARRAHR